MIDDTTPETGLQILDAEMARQFPDARATFRDQAEPAAAIAARIRETGRLHLLGIGGSHWVNTLAEPFYRAAGIDATAHIVSQYMRAPLPGRAVKLLTSQSGASGEVLGYLARDPEGPLCGLTLNRESPLARAIPCLVSDTPPERSYAATRSITVTLAQHAAILSALGLEMPGLEAALDGPATLPWLHGPTGALTRCRAAVFSARGNLQGLADGMALAFMELARTPALGLEAGQFRHGPFELVADDIAVVFVRGRGAEGDNIAGLAEELVTSGFRPLVLDLSGEDPVEGAETIPVPSATGLAAALRALPVAQRMVVDAADARVENMGTPLRSTKITSGEAA